jgi:hypothetical protein
VLKREGQWLALELPRNLRGDDPAWNVLFALHIECEEASYGQIVKRLHDLEGFKVVND